MENILFIFDYHQPNDITFRTFWIRKIAQTNQVKHIIKQHTSILSWKEFFQICKLWKFMWILRTCHVITVQLAWIGRSRGRLYNMRTHYSIVFHVSNLYIIILGLTLLYHYIMNQIYIKHCKHTVVFFNS